jgi:hypothetical protein
VNRLQGLSPHSLCGTTAAAEACPCCKPASIEKNPVIFILPDPAVIACKARWGLFPIAFGLYRDTPSDCAGVSGNAYHDRMMPGNLGAGFSWALSWRGAPLRTRIERSTLASTRAPEVLRCGHRGRRVLVEIGQRARVRKPPHAAKTPGMSSPSTIKARCGEKPPTFASSILAFWLAIGIVDLSPEADRFSMVFGFGNIIPPNATPAARSHRLP